MTSTQNYERNQRVSYFLPHVAPNKKVQPALIHKKNTSMKKDQSLPEITPIYQSPFTNQKAQRKKPDNNETRAAQNQLNILRKNKSERKIGVSPFQQGQKKGQLSRKIQSFKKLYANKIDSELIIRKKNEILNTNKDQSNRKILDKSRVTQTNKQQKIVSVKSPLLQNKKKLDMESFFAENPKYALNTHKQSSPLLKIGQSESILQTEITSNPISSPAETKIAIESKKSTVPTEQAYSSTATKLSNSQEVQTNSKKKSLEEQIMQLDKKLSKSSHESPVKKNRFYQSLDKEFTKKKESINQLSKERGIDEHEEKIGKLKQMGIEYMEDYIQFQQMLLQLRLHKQMLKRQSQVDTVVSQY